SAARPGSKPSPSCAGSPCRRARATTRSEAPAAPGPQPEAAACIASHRIASHRIDRKTQGGDFMNKQLRNAVLVALVALGALAAGTAGAKEGGDQYPNGIETWFAGAVPPPGNYFINYFGHYGGDLYNG